MEFSTRIFNQGRAAEPEAEGMSLQTDAPYFYTILGVQQEEHNMSH